MQGKCEPEYTAGVSVVEMNPEDMRHLGVRPGDRVRLRTGSGEAVATCVAGDLPPGLFSMPLGPAANALVGPETGATGMPAFKGFSVTVEPWPEG